jgi:small subunit ribosomal protein S5
MMDRRKKDKNEFAQIPIDIARVTRVVKGGRRFRFRAAVVIGNRKGKVGFGIGKGPDVSVAINKGYNKAKKAMVDVPIVNGTLPHEISVKYGATSIFLKPAQPGTGIIAGSALRAVLELAGIKDIFGKIYGSTNKINNAKAVIRGLAAERKVEDVARERGIAVEDLEPTIREKKSAKKIVKEIKEKA